MWKGELGARIDLDTITNKEGLYGLGPLVYLAGELLLNNGKAHTFRIVSDSNMSVEHGFDVSAPFFVYCNVTEWETEPLPDAI